MKKYLSVFFSFFFTTVIYSQEYKINGYVVDAENNKEPLPLAQLRLMKPDSTLVTSVLSDNNGYFILNKLKKGKYILSTTFIGYKTSIKNVELTEKNPFVKLGKIAIVPDRTLLREAQVTGLAHELTIKADTFVYHSNAFKVSAGASIAALIQQLPGLSMDGEGNLTFQGKTVSDILVNGKPFFGDVSTAMVNMASDAVQDVSVYEKTDEDKEFAGVVDNDKKTVVDLKIKKEYMASWNINADLGGGTHDRFVGKIFASTFDDNYRAALYAQANNISQNQRVDENGNWSYWGGATGFYTYRRTGGIVTWDNGKKNSDAGYLQIKADVGFNHNNSDIHSLNNNEYFLDNGTHYSFDNNVKKGRYSGYQYIARMVWNIDTLNRLRIGAHGYSNRNRNTSNSYTSVYNRTVSVEKPFMGLTENDIPESLKESGVNSTRQFVQDRDKNFVIYINTSYTHRFANTGSAFSLNMSYDYHKDDGEGDRLTRYRYFNSSVIENDKVNRQYATLDFYRKNFSVDANLEGSLGKKMNYGLTYMFEHIVNNEYDNNYRLDRYEEYATMIPHVGYRPSTADSLKAVMDIENSHCEKNIENIHSVVAKLSVNTEKFEGNITLTGRASHEKLKFKYMDKIYNPSRRYVVLRPRVRMKWKPVKNGELNFFYNGYERYSSLVNQVPMNDTRDEILIEKYNPDLKRRWIDDLSLSGRYFSDKRGDNYSFYISFASFKNDIVNMIEINPETGQRAVTQGNVNGNYSVYMNISTEQPLDSARRWTLSSFLSYNRSRNKSYVGTAGNELGLSEVKTHSPRASLSLKWRKDIWSVSLRGVYNGELSRYKNVPEYNQSGHIYECWFEPQVDLPFGMKINSNFGLYKRNGYADALLNHEQWLWNLTVSQSFLKNKSLTLMFEAVDILRQRTSEYSTIDAFQRSFGRVDTFMSYFMLHVVYSLNVGGKK